MTDLLFAQPAPTSIRTDSFTIRRPSDGTPVTSTLPPRRPRTQSPRSHEQRSSTGEPLRTARRTRTAFMRGLRTSTVVSGNRTERRLSEAVDESCLVDEHFCGEDMSPPQLRGGGMTGVIAVRRARIRRGAPAEGRACGRPGRRMKRFPAARRRSRRGTVSSRRPGASVPARWRERQSAPRRLQASHRAPAHRGARTIRTTTVTWNAQLARLERRAIRCPAAPGADGELISEPGTPQRNFAGQARAWTRQGIPAAVTAATAKTPLQITCPCRSSGPPAFTANTPKLGLEILRRIRTVNWPGIDHIT